MVRDLPGLDERPLPRIGVSLGAWVPGWVLRAAAAFATGAVLAIGTQRVGMYPGIGWTVVGIAMALVAIWPAPILALTATVLTGLLIALDGYGPFDPVAFALFPLAYAAVRSAWWAERVAPTARVELAALVRGLGRGCVVVGGTLGLGAGAFVLAGQASAGAVIAAGVALVALVWLVIATRRS
jgi:hypothetical protein